MSFGEATLAEHLQVHKDLLAESEALLGAKVYHVSPTKSEIVRDRLGGTKKIEKPGERSQVQVGSVVYNPSEEQLKSVGIQERVDCLLTMATADIPENFNKIDSRFIIDTNYDHSAEFKIKDVKGIGQVKDEYVYLAIGLVSK